MKVMVGGSFIVGRKSGEGRNRIYVVWSARRLASPFWMAIDLRVRKAKVLQADLLINKGFALYFEPVSFLTKTRPNRDSPLNATFAESEYCHVHAYSRLVLSTIFCVCGKAFLITRIIISVNTAVSMSYMKTMPFVSPPLSLPLLQFCGSTRVHH